MTTPARQLVDVFELALDRRQREQPGRLRPARVVGRNQDGTHRLTRLDGTCQLRGDVGPEGTGAVLQLPTGPIADRGTTGVGAVDLVRQTGTLYVESIDPDLYVPGTSYTVEVVGRGFTETTVFDFLMPDSADDPLAGDEINPAVTITAQRLLSSELIELDITVAAGADPLQARIAYDDPAHIN